MPITKEEAQAWSERFESTRLWLGKFKEPVYYAKSLMKFCSYSKMDPDQLLALREHQNNHECEKLLDRFVAEDGYPNSVMRAISVAVHSFFRHNYCDLAGAAGRVTFVKQKPYRTPVQKDLARFIEGANLRDKALITFMAVTRIREETVCLLTWRHVLKDLIEEPKDPPQIALMSYELKGKGRKQYQGLQQHTFLTPEAKTALLTYKAWRERVKHEKITPETSLFADVCRPFGPMSKIQIRKLFQRASRRSGLLFSPHDVGRFTQTQLEAARLQPNWIKKICGHKVKGEENPYSQPKIEALREAYATAIPFLTFKVSQKLESRELLELRRRVKFLEDERERDLERKRRFIIGETSPEVLEAIEGLRKVQGELERNG